jgi:hypothetical protein
MKKYLKITLAIFLIAALLLPTALTVGASSAAEEECRHGTWSWIITTMAHVKRCHICFVYFDNGFHTIDVSTNRCTVCGYQW